MKKFKELRPILKDLAHKIRENKLKLKDHQREHNGYGGEYYSKVFRLVYEFRHKHIAYCVLRGTPRDKIEKPGEKNEPNKTYIKQIIEEYSSERATAPENVCAGS